MFVNQRFLKFIPFFCLMLLMASISLAQKPKNYDAVIHSRMDHRYKGFLLDVSEKGVTIDYLGESKFISADSIASIKIKRTGSFRRFALTGGAAGLLAGIPIYIDGNNKGKLSSLALPVIMLGTAMGGAFIGSLINSVTSVQRFDKINVDIPFRNIQPVLLRYSKASPARVPAR